MVVHCSSLCVTNILAMYIVSLIKSINGFLMNIIQIIVQNSHTIIKLCEIE